MVLYKFPGCQSTMIMSESIVTIRYTIQCSQPSCPSKIANVKRKKKLWDVKVTLIIIEKLLGQGTRCKICHTNTPSRVAFRDQPVYIQEFNRWQGSASNRSVTNMPATFSFFWFCYLLGRASVYTVNERGLQGITGIISM